MVTFKLVEEIDEYLLYWYYDMYPVFWTPLKI